MQAVNIRNISVMDNIVITGYLGVIANSGPSHSQSSLVIAGLWWRYEDSSFGGKSSEKLDLARSREIHNNMNKQVTLSSIFLVHSTCDKP
jgi:hypothetical protein